ncbi:putative polygalacturonase [Acorus gramineus]|uniref:Polygalacturonase n=1 Tax=Acorus gramineus TaxID=55184 RepID=A0AAV9B5K3_ACOGR|nr:putative polygalacturonase [Acorus gramineus]
MVLGDIHAPSDTTWIGIGTWISFNQISGLTIDGSGTINGMGKVWWDTSCKRHPELLISLAGCNNLSLKDFKLVNGPRNHLAITGSKGLTISHLTITAAGDSPNTDGIDITQSNNVIIENCTIGTGDDCIALGNSMSNVNITGVACGPGHGISIGSLGKDSARATVEQIHGGSGYARGITFNNITLTSTANPIIIDQFYCDNNKPCGISSSAVEVSDVRFTNVKGTVQLDGSNTQVGIRLNCSATVPCKNIIVDDVQITSTDPKVQVTSICSNAQVINTCTNCIPNLNCAMGSTSESFIQMPIMSDDNDSDSDYLHMEL